MKNIKSQNDTFSIKTNVTLKVLVLFKLHSVKFLNDIHSTCEKLLEAIEIEKEESQNKKIV